MNALTYAQLGTDTIMKKYTPPELPPNHRFHYHQGVFLTGAERVYALTKDKKYYDYIKAWVDYHLQENGDCPTCHTDEFDDMQPGLLLFDLYETTKDERYKILLDRIIKAAEEHPKNALGGVWHKKFMKNQMWLDCMYMMGVVVTRYAVTFDKPYLIKVVHRQMRLMYENMKNPKTGLLYHAWDDSKEAPWADKATGCSPEHWGRAMGWYVVALAEIIEMLPDDNEYKNDFIAVEKELLSSVIKYRDSKMGLWYQIIDKGDVKGNWHETSCSCLFTYAIVKSARLGVIDNIGKDFIEECYNGILTMVNVSGEKLGIKGVCIGTGVGDINYYFERETVEDDLHGMGAFILMCSEIAKSEKGE